MGVNLSECSPKPTVTIRFYSRLFYVPEKVMDVGVELSEQQKNAMQFIFLCCQSICTIARIVFFSCWPQDNFRLRRSQRHQKKLFQVLHVQFLNNG